MERLKQLETAGLIHRVRARRDSQYSFHHTLIQDAAYSSLLKGERRQLHLAVGEALEQAYPGHLTSLELAPILGHHFYEAGDHERALRYYTSAGDQAVTQYATAEAAQHYTRAVEVAELQADRAALRNLYRARGVAYDLLGEFDAARADHEAALELARRAGDRGGEWQALLDLGSVWTARDYVRTGDYYREALDLARAMDIPDALGQSLNRIGNWHANIEQPLEALRYHVEALTIFASLNDLHGLAQTHDLLGITNVVGGDWIAAYDHYQQAVPLFRQLDDRPGLISSLATMSGRGGSYELEAVLVAPANAAETDQEVEAALEMTREIGWRAGEAYVLFGWAMCLGPRGEYARALAYAEAAHRIAEEIGHREWNTGAQYTLGMLHRDLLSLPDARRHLELARDLARQTGSLNWLFITTGHLASALVASHTQARLERLDSDTADAHMSAGSPWLSQAESLLAEVLKPGTPAQTVGQRLCWYAHAELALARNDPGAALQIADDLIASAPAVPARLQRTIPALAILRGRALAALARADEAEAALHAARRAAAEQAARSTCWRIDSALGRLYRDTSRRDEAQREFSAARAAVEALAGNVPDDARRAHFLRVALGTISQDGV